MKKILGFTLVLLFTFNNVLGIINPVAPNAEAAGDEIFASAVSGGTPISTIEERIDYAYKVTEYYFNPYELPAYVSSYSCGITAGGNVVGFYDRIYEELIPNHTGSYFWGAYFWGTHGDEVDYMFDNLYTAMGATSEGVTMNGYLTGLSSYITSKGRTASLTSVLSGGGLNSSAYKSALSNGKLLSVFLIGFSIIDFNNLRTYTNYDTVKAYVHSGAHVMIAYGYYNVSYYNSSGVCFRQDSYLYVSTGYTTPRLSLVQLNQYCQIYDCYISEIY